MAFQFFNRGREAPPELADSGRVPPGQVLTVKWPVLHYGGIPRFDPAKWDFQIVGLVQQPLRFTWDEFKKLPRTTVHCDIHCVTRWSRLDNTFEGVAFKDIYKLVQRQPNANYVMVHAEKGFTANIPLDDLLHDNVLLADTWEGQPLTPEHGFPLRMLVPHLYFWKSAKWIRGFEFMATDQPGFWEQYGYHMRGDPWKEERYS